MSSSSRTVRALRNDVVGTTVTTGRLAMVMAGPSPAVVGLEQVVAGEDGHAPAVVVDDRVGAVGAARELAAGVGDRGVGRQRVDLGGHHVAHVGVAEDVGLVVGRRRAGRAGRASAS